MNKYLFRTCLSIIALFALATPVWAATGTDYVPLTTLPGLFTEGKAITNPIEMVSGIYGLAIGIASVIGTVMLIYAGFEYMYVESISKKSDAKKRITNVFIGLVVILGSYILLRTINPKLVEFNIALKGGSGRLSGLVADYTKSVEGIRNAVLKEAEQKKEISLILAQANATDQKIQELQASRAKVAASKTLSAEEKQAQIASIDEEIAALTKKKNELVYIASQKTVESSQDTIEAILGPAQDADIVRIVKDIQEGGQSDAGFAALLSKKDAIQTRLDKELTRIKNLPDSPDKTALVAKFETRIADYKLYVEKSKQVTAGFQQILKIATPGYSLPERMKELDGYFSQFVSTEVSKVTEAYKAQNKAEFAQKIQGDVENNMKIVKALFEKPCQTYSSKTAGLAICAQ